MVTSFRGFWIDLITPFIKALPAITTIKVNPYGTEPCRSDGLICRTSNARFYYPHWSPSTHDCNYALRQTNTPAQSAFVLCPNL